MAVRGQWLFRSDNFLSNETGYQYVIPDLISIVKPGGSTLAWDRNRIFPTSSRSAADGVHHRHPPGQPARTASLQGALRDVGRSSGIPVAGCFRANVSGLGAATPVQSLFAAYGEVPASDELYQENLKAVIDWLTRKHEFKLVDEDVKGIEYVYHDAFFVGGPHLNYSFGSVGGMGRGNSPTYEQLMLQTDGTGQNRGYLATEEAWSYLKDFESRNLLVPVVGNFGGPRAFAL
jgi:hypothetical protein